MFPPDSLPHFLPNSKSVDPVSPFVSELFLTYLQPTLREGMCNTRLCPEAAPVPASLTGFALFRHKYNAPCTLQSRG